MPRDKYGKTVKTESRTGIAKKPDGFTGEDQAGSSKTQNAGKVTEKKGATPGKTTKEKSTGKDANYSRKRS